MPARRCCAAALLALPALLSFALQAPAQAAAPVAADESAVSTGAWFCSRHLEALSAGARGGAPEVRSAVQSFALGYVYGVSDAVGRPFPETSANQDRIRSLVERSCSEDPARAIREATLLAGRAMLADAGSASAKAAADATGALACSVHLAAGADAQGRPSARTLQVRNWADGYINARFERAGRGLIPTAKNKALMLERFAAACTGTPSATVREAARRVVDDTLPAR